MLKHCRTTFGRMSISVVLITYLVLTNTFSATSGTPEYYNPFEEKPFFLCLGLGYGVSNNPVYDKSVNKMPGGLTVSGSLGYRVNSRVSIEFGPSVWIEGKDIFQNNVPSEERVSNKRTMVTLNGHYLISKKYPLTFKLGGGIGTLVYSKEKNTVAIDGSSYDETEYYSGAVFTTGIMYRLKLSEKIFLHPAFNFYYCNINNQKIEYSSAINNHQPSLTSDLRIQLLVNF